MHSLSAVSTPELRQYRILPTGLEVYWESGLRRTVPYGWLRDQDPEAWHKNGQKLSTTQDWPEQLFPEQVEEKGHTILITWAGDSHVSVVSKDSLWKYVSNLDASSGLVMWNRMLDTDMCFFECEAVREDERHRFNWLTTFQDYGFVGLRNVEASVQGMAETLDRLGPIRETNFGRIFEIKAKSEPDNLSDSNLELPPRTENPYRDPAPGIHSIFCIRAASHGGMIILVDGAFIMRKLKKQFPQAYRLLLEVPVNFRYQDDRVWLEHERCIIEEKPDGTLKSLAFNNRSVNQFSGPQAEQKGWYQAYRTLEREILNPKNQLKLSLKAGELLLINNRRILHGQTAYPPSSDRLFLGCYLEHDSLGSEMRKLKVSLSKSSV